MKRLKTLNRDPTARSAVAAASKQNQSGDMLDFETREAGILRVRGTRSDLGRPR